MRRKETPEQRAKRRAEEKEHRFACDRWGNHGSAFKNKLKAEFYGLFGMYEHSVEFSRRRVDMLVLTMCVRSMRHYSWFEDGHPYLRRMQAKIVEARQRREHFERLAGVPVTPASEPQTCLEQWQEEQQNQQ